MPLRAAWLLAACVVSIGCAFPRRTTPLAPVPNVGTSLDAPEDLWRLQVATVYVPPRTQSGLAWDSDGSGPDIFVRIYRDDDLIIETSVVDNNHRPEWDESSEGNLLLPRTARFRFEVWDDDGLTSTPVGSYRREGLPHSAVPGVDARITLQGGAGLTIRLADPEAHRGVGLTYELHPDGFKVVSVLAHSPAGRAGLENGDRITAIDGQEIASLGEARAATMLAQAGQSGDVLTVDKDGRTRAVELDGGHVWLAD